MQLVCAARVIALVMYTTQVNTVGVTESVFRPGVLVPDVNRASPAAEAGLKRGDIILKVENLEASASRTSIPRVVQYIMYVVAHLFLHPCAACNYSCSDCVCVSVCNCF